MRPRSNKAVKTTLLSLAALLCAFCLPAALNAGVAQNDWTYDNATYQDGAITLAAYPSSQIAYQGTAIDVKQHVSIELTFPSAQNLANGATLEGLVNVFGTESNSPFTTSFTYTVVGDQASIGLEVSGIKGDSDFITAVTSFDKDTSAVLVLEYYYNPSGFAPMFNVAGSINGQTFGNSSVVGDISTELPADYDVAISAHSSVSDGLYLQLTSFNNDNTIPPSIPESAATALSIGLAGLFIAISRSKR